MGTKTTTFPIEIKGGLNTSITPIQLGLTNPGSAIRLMNFEPSIQGGYRRINGYSKWDSAIVPTVSSSSLILGVAFFDGKVIAVREDKIHYSTGTGWTQIATGRTHTTKHRFHIFNFSGTRKIIGVDGVNYPYTWDNTTFVNVNTSTDVQGATCVCAFKDHMFYSKGSLLTFSVPFDEADFTPASGAGSIRLPKTITGLYVFRSQLFVFTESSIHVINGSSLADFTLESVNETIGCIASDTIQEVSGDVAFLSSDGVRLLGSTDRTGDFSNQTTSKYIQAPLNSFIGSYSSFSSTVIRGKSQYRVFSWDATREPNFSEGFVGAQFRPQDPESFEWGKLQGFKVYSIDSKVHNSVEYIVFSSDTEYVYQMEDGNDFDGTDIQSSFWTPYISFTDPTYRKVLYKMFIYLSPEETVNGLLSLNFNLDSATNPNPPSTPFSAGASGAVYGVDVYGTGTYRDLVRRSIRTPLIGSGGNVSFRFDFSDGAPFIIDTLMVEFMQKDRR